MVMGLKQFTVKGCYPEEMIHVTLNHLNTLYNMIDKNTEASKKIDETKARFVLMIHKFNGYDFQVIKQQVSKLYQGKHIKVSLFIQDKVQSSDGTIYLNFTGKNPVFTPIGNKPGTLKILKGKHK